MILYYTQLDRRTDYELELALPTIGEHTST